MTDTTIRPRKTERLTVRTSEDIKAGIRQVMVDEGRSESDVVNILLGEAIRARA